MLGLKHQEVSESWNRKNLDHLMEKAADHDRHLISPIIVFAIILLISSQPLSALGDFIFGPLTSVRRFGNVIEGMTPLMFTGLAVIILFKPGLFNLSMEGAFFIGAVAACAAPWDLDFPEKRH